MNRSTLILFAAMIAVPLMFAVVARYGAQATFDGMSAYRDDIASGKIDQAEILANLEHQRAESEAWAEAQRQREEAAKQTPAGAAMSLVAAGLGMVVLLGLGAFLVVAGRQPPDEPLPPLPPLPARTPPDTPPPDAPPPDTAGS